MEDDIIDGSPIIGTPSQNQPLDTTDWKGKFNGASSALGRAQKEATEYKAKHDGLFVELEALRAKYENSTASLNDLATEKATLVAQHQAEVARLKKEQDTGRMIATQHPALLPLYLEGLVNINGMTDEQIPTYLSNMATKLQALNAQTVQQTLTGSTPPPPTPTTQTGGGTLTLDQVEQRMRTMNRNDPEYGRLRAMREKLLRE